MTKLKVGAIGTGNIFRGAHLRAWSSHPATELSGVYDISRNAADTVAREVPGVRIYEDYRDMLADPSIDIIDISTPNLYHSSLAIAALEHGKHVFCEKPDAISVAEAEKMAKAAQASGKLLMTMRNNRFTEQAKFIRNCVEDGKLGELYMGRCAWIRRQGIPGRGGWFTTQALSGGGPLIDLGVHMIDLAVWLAGNPRPLSVSGEAYRQFADHPLSGMEPSQGVFDVEDLAAGFIRFDNGACLQLEFSWASYIAEDQKLVEWRGTEGGLSLINNQLRLYTDLLGRPIDMEPKLPPASLPPHTANIHHFIGCVLGDEEPLYTPEQGVDLLRILTAIYESAERGQEIRL